MSYQHRWILVVLIVVVDLVVFFLPFSALFLAYVILVNPRWFRRFLDHLDGDPSASAEELDSSESRTRDRLGGESANSRVEPQPLDPGGG